MNINVYFNGKLLTNSLIDHKINKKNVKVVTNWLIFLSDREKIISALEENDVVLVKDVTSQELISLLNKVFKPVSAAGGVVRNSRWETLMIFRNGMWDLPKGKQERGEKIEDCAVREVEEECGIVVDGLGAKICDTYHIYFMFNEWVVKTTSWYNMTCNTEKEGVPQIEEGITKIDWIKDEDLKDYVEKSYPNIREVFKFFLPTC